MQPMLVVATLVLAAGIAALVAGIGTLVLAAVAVDLEKHHDCLPSEVHLSMAEDPYTMKVAWRTSDSSCESRLEYGLVDTYGMALNRTGSVALGSSYHITENLMCTRPARDRPFQAIMHVALMTELEPRKRYWYQISGGEEFTFRAALIPGDTSKFSFIAFGDMGENRKGHKALMSGTVVDAMLSEMDRAEVELILHVGDLAYANGKPKIWDSFMSLIQPLAAQVPYMVSVGNHEVDYIGGDRFDMSGEESYHPNWGNFGDDSGGECGSMTARRFAMPAGASKPTARRRTPEEAAAHAILDHAAYAAADLAHRINTSTATNTSTSSSSSGDSSSGDSSSSNSSSSSSGDSSSSSGSDSGSGSGSSRSGGSSGDSSRSSSSDGSSSSSSSGSRKLNAGSMSQSSSMQRPEHVSVGGQLNTSGEASARELPTRSVPYDNPPFWYSYDYGIVHFITISTEHDVSPGSVQYRWLQADLEAVDRCTTPWVVLALHRPMYVLYPHKSNRIVGDHLKDFLEDLLLDYKVDMCVSGHVHAYYRTCDVRSNECVSDDSGISHFVVGTAGHELAYIDDEQMEWGSTIVVDYGFMRFDVDGDSMHAYFIRSNDLSVADHTELVAQIYTKEECRDFKQRSQ